MTIDKKNKNVKIQTYHFECQMAGKHLSKEEHILLDTELASIALYQQGELISARRLDEGIRRDWETLKQIERLPEADQLEIARTIEQLIIINRDLAKQVVPPIVLFTLERQHYETGHMSIDPRRIALEVNEYVEKQKEFIPKESLATLARIKKIVARTLGLAVRKSELDKETSVHEQAYMTLIFDHAINDLIDHNARKSLEEIIAIVMEHMRKNCFGNSVREMSFYLVNEENHYRESKRLTRITVSGTTNGDPVVLKTSTTSDNFSREHGTEPFTEEEKTLRYNAGKDEAILELRIDERKLGVLVVKLSPGSKLSPQEICYLHQAQIRLDTKIDETLRGRRLARLDKLAHKILDKYGALDEHFEEGIAELMYEVCLYSQAYEADLLLEVSGDGKHFIAKRFNDDGQVTNLPVDDQLRRMASMRTSSLAYRSKDTLVKDIIDPSQETEPGRKRVIGKIIFKARDGEDLSADEDKTFLSLAAMIIGSHALQWRKNLQLLIEGVDPKIAMAKMREGIEEMVKEKLTILMTDISGYTAICAKLQKLFKDSETIEDIAIIKRVIEEFLILIQEVCESYCGTWDKAVGDMGIVEFGAPIDKKGKDPLGFAEFERHPEYHALNALKAALLIQKRLEEITRTFRKELVEIAKKKYAEPEKGTDEYTRFEQNPESWYLDQLCDDTGISPSIDTTTSVYTGEVGYGRLALQSSHDWTAIGTKMNTAARTQHAARRGQIMIPYETRELVKPLIENDIPVPFHPGDKGEKRCETWSEFLRNKLGVDPEKINYVCAGQYCHFKNLEGTHLVCSFNLADANAKVPTINQVLNFEHLRKFENREFAVQNMVIAGNEMILKLRTIPCKEGQEPVPFNTIIPQGSIEEKVTVYTSHSEFSDRKKHRTDHTILVQDGRLVEFTYESAGKLQDMELHELLKPENGKEHNEIFHHKKTPAGCYVLMETTKHGNSTVLKLSKKPHILKVVIRETTIRRNSETIKGDNEILNDFRAYVAEIADQIDPLSQEQKIIFVHKGQYYEIASKDAIEVLRNKAAI